ncbi:MAG: MtrB/PioB family decaheme-associated outer membrane protein [Pseudomonadota bacterium]
MARMNLRYVVAAVLGLAAAQAGAQDAARPDTSNWTCESCPFFEGYDSEATAGAIYADGANASFGRHTGIDDEKTYVDAAASGQWRSEAGLNASYSFEDLGLDSRSGRAAFGREGLFDVELRYEGLPYRRYDATVTPFRGFESLTLPGGWVRGGTTRAMTALSGSLLDRDVGTERKTVGLSAQWTPGTQWSVFASYDRQEKDGTGIVYGAFLVSAIELPEPIEYVTDTFEVGTQWASERATARLAYSGSFFRNLNVALNFQNPYSSPFPTAANGRLALAPDNDAQQVGLSGNFRFGLANAVLSYSASVGQLTQDDALLPVSTASNAATPRATLDGKVDVAHYGLALSLQPIQGLSLRGTVRYDERDDTTAPLSVAYIITDTVAGGTDVGPRYDYERTRIDGLADYAPFRWLRVGVGARHDTIERRFAEVGETVEQGSYLRLRLTPFGNFAFTVKGGQLHRDADDFDLAARTYDDNPFLRRYNLANRDRDFLDALASWTVADAVTISLNAQVTDDAYRRSPIGLTDGNTRTIGGNVSWAVSEALTLYADAGYQRQKSKQLGQARPAGAFWEARNEDDFRNGGLGARWKLNDRWSFTTDLLYAESQGDVLLLTGGVPEAYPQLRTRLGSARVGVDFAYSEALSFGARYLYESLDEDDWARDFVTPNAVLNLLSLGAPSDSHDVSLLTFTFTYRFGTVKATADAGE